MINLLSTNAKEANEREFKFRIVVVFVIIFSFLLLVGIVPLLAWRVSLASQIKKLASERNDLSAKEDGRRGQEQEALISEVNEKIDVLTLPLAKNHFKGEISRVFETILADSRKLAENGNSTIHINKTVYQTVELKKKGKKDDPSSSQAEVEHAVAVVGVADSRKDFVDFVELLKTNKNFISVDAPITGLVEDRDINFSVRILLDNK